MSDEQLRYQDVKKDKALIIIKVLNCVKSVKTVLKVLKL